MRIKILRGVIVFVSLVTIYGFADIAIFSKGEIDEKWLIPEKIDPAYLDISDQWVDSVFETLSEDEKIAQLLMVAAYSNRDDNHKQEISKLIKKYNIGGLIFFQGGPYRQAVLTNHFQSITKTPLLIAMDAEWGPSMRLDSTIKYPKQMMLGAIQSNQLVYQMGVDIAQQLKRLGVHVNFAPVVDVNNNPANPVINARSFGENKVNVARKGLAYMMGLQDNHVIACAKHFPGHGDTDADSHYSLPVIKHQRERLESIELYPFRQLVRAGLGSMMIAHLNIPALDSTPNLASTLSNPIVHGLLREQMGFKGLVFTDALNMKGVSNYFEPGELEVRALIAGNDVLLMPASVPKAIEAIKDALKKGTIQQSEIDEKCRRVLAAKYWVGLSNKPSVNLNNIYDDLNRADFKLHLRKLIEHSLTVAINEDLIIPFKKLDTLNIASVSIGEAADNPFSRTLELYTDVDKKTISKRPSPSDINNLLRDAENNNLLVVSIHNTDMRASRQFGITDETIQAIDKLSEKQNVVLVLFANPYILDKFKNLDNLIGLVVAYEESDLIKEISGQLLFGGMPATGQLPVTATDGFPAGTMRETFGRSRLKYSMPEEVNMNPDSLKKIDSIAIDAIESKATPGCQILVAKDGVVVYSKAFGHHTYLKKKEVSNSDIYDLASLTKICASLPPLMKLTENEIISLEDPIGKYLPELDTSNKKDLKIGDILTHQAGLEPWIPFYLSTLESLDPDIDLFSSKLTDDYPFKLAARYYMTKHLKYKDYAFNNSFSLDYPMQVSQSMYLNKSYRDTIYNRIVQSEVRKGKDYKYSDLGYYLFYKMIEDIYGEPFYNLVAKNYYKPLGASTLGFLPLNRFDLERIVPTENDIVFRRQLIHGHVHDPGAAMLGGISGHAGLFSNANDLAKLMQMYLQNGVYGGKRYFEKETLQLFTSCPNCESGNRRGYGFDKPKLRNHRYGPTCDEISRESYGHTGFTGTMAWVDPDKNLIYIFLSNRIHPDANNTKLINMDVRTRIQAAIYNAIEE
jgi:beta-glucosidase-like glycosyl hydrolase/CubicO group peptidase (beta-lactamase class C family)